MSNLVKESPTLVQPRSPTDFVLKDYFTRPIIPLGDYFRIRDEINSDVETGSRSFIDQNRDDEGAAFNISHFHNYSAHIYTKGKCRKKDYDGNLVKTVDVKATNYEIKKIEEFSNNNAFFFKFPLVHEHIMQNVSNDVLKKISSTTFTPGMNRDDKVVFKGRIVDLKKEDVKIDCHRIPWSFSLELKQKKSLTLYYQLHAVGYSLKYRGKYPGDKVFFMNVETEYVMKTGAGGCDAGYKFSNDDLPVFQLSTVDDNGVRRYTDQFTINFHFHFEKNEIPKFWNPNFLRSKLKEDCFHECIDIVYENGSQLEEGGLHVLRFEEIFLVLFGKLVHPRKFGEMRLEIENQKFDPKKAKVNYKRFLVEGKKSGPNPNVGKNWRNDAEIVFMHVSAKKFDEIDVILKDDVTRLLPL